MVEYLGQRDLVKVFANLLDKHKVSYLLTGSLAVSYYGFPRATHDIDFILEIPKQRKKQLRQVITDLGTDYISQPFEDILEQSGFFNIYHQNSGIKIDFWFVNGNEFRGKYNKKQTIEVSGKQVNLICSEDLIINKLRWCKK